MAKRVAGALATDFTEVIAFLKDQGIVSSSAPESTIRLARSIHDSTYSLILWRFRLRGLPTHGQVFIEEVASDALQILPQVLAGYGKTPRLLMRGILENTLRHIYFSDHPIEFQRMNREAKWFLTVDDLCQYARNHPFFLDTEKEFDALSQISSLYSELSASVHGRRVQDLEMRRALRKIVYDEPSATLHAELLRKCAQACNFLIAIFHHTQMQGFQLEDRRIILRTLPPAARQIWRTFGA